jgi:hypothetical protein
LLFTFDIAHLLDYQVDHAWYFPSSHVFTISCFWFYYFLASHICDRFSFSSFWNILLLIFCNTDMVDMDYFNFSIYQKVLISQSRLKRSFGAYIVLGWQLFSLRAWNTLLHTFMTFRVCAGVLIWFLWSFQHYSFFVL